VVAEEQESLQDPQPGALSVGDQVASVAVHGVPLFGDVG